MPAGLAIEFFPIGLCYLYLSVVWGFRVKFLDRLNLLIGLYLASLRNVFKLYIWMPFFIYACLQFAVLILCVNYVSPRIYPVLFPLASIISDRMASAMSHYPGLYLLLPDFFQFVKISMGVVFEGLAAGLTVILFIRVFARAKKGEWKLSYSFSKWPHLLLTWTIITAILVVLNWYLPHLTRAYLVGSPRRIMLFEIGIRFITVLIYSIFIYAVPAVIVMRLNFLGALAASIRFFSRYPIFSFFLALIPYLITLPFSHLSGNADSIIAKFSPELIFYVLSMIIIVAVSYTHLRAHET